MRIVNELLLKVPPDRCFAMLLDLPGTAGCVPGSRVGPIGDDGTHPVELIVKVGPMQFAYAGRAWVVQADDAAGEAVLSAEMSAQRGQDRMRATSTVRVSPQPAGSRVELATELELEGKAAHLGRGIIEQVAKRLIDRAAGCLEQRALDIGIAAGRRDS